MSCPGCKATDPKQRPLWPAELHQIGFHGWLSGALVCTYCRCVHSGGLVRGQFRQTGWQPR
jgi:hypothetical protein